MIRSLYSAASGMVSQLVKQDITAHNLANAQTPGFKRSRTVSESFAQEMELATIRLKDVDRTSYPDSPVSPVLVRTGEGKDYSQGPLQATDNPLDVAISGAGYFCVRSEEGVRCTREGNFRLDSDRFLCTQFGERVLGEHGAIRIPTDNWHITEDGTIMSEDRKIEKLRLAGSELGTTRIVQGSIEGSNVNVVREMVAMITNMRNYEANQRVIQSTDQTLGKTVSEVGKV